MESLIDKKRRTKSRPTIHSVLNSHKWATKVEMHRLIAGKPDLKIKEAPKPKA
jgi:hypothetical protein